MHMYCSLGQLWALWLAWLEPVFCVGQADLWMLVDEEISDTRYDVHLDCPVYSKGSYALVKNSMGVSCMAMLRSLDTRSGR
jgi:hypothetical protein